MFWGLNLKPNRKYSQTATKSFHISQAALDAETSANTVPNQIFISSENQKFLICTLRRDTCEQVMLDLNVAEGDEICFQSVGSGHITLSGYIIEENNPFMLNELEEEEDSEIEEPLEKDLRKTLNQKTIKVNVEKGAKTKKSTSEDEEDGDDSDLNGTNEFSESDDNDSDDEEDRGVDEEDDSDDDKIELPKAKHPKLEKLQKQQNGIGKANAEKEKKENIQQQKAGGERVLSGGIKVEDMRIGKGPEAKAGKRALVYYEGRLKSNNKVFDSLKTGNGFKFNIGRGDVIKGWDVGVIGMKVGGRRRIVCPPHMAYGTRGSPPTIPPNSTLVFEVELKGIN